MKHIREQLFISVAVAFVSCVGNGQTGHRAVGNDSAATDAALPRTIAPPDGNLRAGDGRLLEKNDDDTPAPNKKYLITKGGTGLLSVGQTIPERLDGCLITRDVETRWEEGTEFSVPVCTVSEERQNILKIEPAYDYATERYSEKIGDIYILSDKFKTAENIGLQSTIEAFMTAYPDFRIWYSYVGDIYVIETERLENIQFFLDGNDFMKAGGPEFESDMTELRPSDFKKDSKIAGIRIYGAPEP